MFRTLRLMLCFFPFLLRFEARDWWKFLDKLLRRLGLLKASQTFSFSRSRANDPRVVLDALFSNSSSSNNSFEMQQIAASLEDKMTIKMNQIMNQMKALVVTTPAKTPSKSSEESFALFVPLVDKVLPSTKDIQPPVIQKSQDPVKPVSSPISPEPSSAQVDNSSLSKESSKETKLPYPSRVEHEKKGENDKVQIQKFWEMFKKIHVDITLADALILVPKYQKMLKSLLSNKEKLNEMANTPVSETCSAIILKKLPEKLGDPGQFLIPCNFSELKCKALADLGASINLMPFSVYTKLASCIDSTRMTFRTSNALFVFLRKLLEMSFRIRWEIYFPGSDFVVSIRSTTSAIVDEFESLLGDIIKQKEELKGISLIPVLEEGLHYVVSLTQWELCENMATIEFVKDNVEINHEVFKNDSENSLGIHDDKEEEIAFLDGLLEDENFFKMNDKKVESFERKTKEDFEKTKNSELRKRKELQVFHPDIEILGPFGGLPLMSGVIMCFRGFYLVDKLFPMKHSGKIFDPGITFMRISL
ncbi:hypothetical protein Tco_0555795 [Tanacetum coccineum]